MALLIRGGQVLSGAPAALARADVLIEGDRIAAVGPALAAPAGARVIDAVRPHRAPRHGQRPHPCGEPPRPRPGRELDARGPADLLARELWVSHAGGRVPLGGHRRHRDAQDRLHRRRTISTSRCPPITDETFEAVARAYTDVGVRVVLAPAVADVVFYQTVPGTARSPAAGPAPHRRGHRSRRRPRACSTSPSG